VRALRLIQKNPGLSATRLAPILWPHIQLGLGPMNPTLLAAQNLRRWKNMGYVRIKYNGNPFKERTRCIYYLTDYGYEICEHYRHNNS